MMKVLIVSDNGTTTGYGRIADEIGMRLHKRGHNIMALGYYYDGLLPPQLDGVKLPYWVGSLAGKPNVMQSVAGVMGAFDPDIVLSIQDFPYHVQLFHGSGVDWSKHGRVLITPVDGVPVEPDWIRLAQSVDGVATISQFGVEAFKAQGVQATLCRPGVNVDTFHRLHDEKRAELRGKLGLAPDAFLLGSMCQNQGRKAVTLMMRGFNEFAKDKPNARMLLDMDEVSPAGWNLPNIIEVQGWDASKFLFRRHAVDAGVVSLNERYNILDAHVVLAHREGYGLPLSEAMACGVVSLAMDYCSGTEIVGEGRGVLIPTTDYTVPGTWGGAEDRFPNMAAYVERLQWLHDSPFERHAMAQRGMAWAREHTWDGAADAVETMLLSVDGKRRAWQAQGVAA